MSHDDYHTSPMLTDFERKVVVDALEEYVENGQDRNSTLSAVSELHARSVATARDLALRFQ